MNYYEKHIGDYLKDTVSLSMLEDGAYNRLLDQYYQTEHPLPATKSEIYRMARATSAAERKAVDYVVGRYFELTTDGYRQKRCDELIESFWEKDSKKEAGKENDRERQQRARERRKSLFEELRVLGIVPEYNAKTKELETLLSRATSQGKSLDDHEPVTRDNTATQSPITSNQEIPPKSPKGESPPKTRKSKPGITFQEFADRCRDEGQSLIPDDDPIFDYYEKIGLPDDFGWLAWREFSERHRAIDKRYLDWRAAFRNCVRDNWYKLWWAQADGTYSLTTAGYQAKRKHDEDAA